jgi:hypothetical protein
LTLDSTNSAARDLLTVVYPAPESMGESPGWPGPLGRWRRELSSADSGGREWFRDTLPALDAGSLRAVASLAQLEGRGLVDAHAAVRQLRAKAGRPAERIEAALAEHALALNEGRIRDALAASSRLADLVPAAHPELRIRALDALYGDGDLRAGEAAARALERVAASRPATDPSARAIQLSDACVLAQWRLQRGDTTQVRHVIERLRADPLQTVVHLPAASAGPAACAELLEGALAVEQQGAAAAAAVAGLDSLAFTAAASGDAVTYAPLLIARLHERLGDPRAALEAVRRRADPIGWPRYLASALYMEGRYATLAGAPGLARLAYQRYLALRGRPDPELRARTDEVRGALAALPAGY